MEVILLDLFTVNYVVSSAIALITGHFINFREILRKYRKSAATLHAVWLEMP